MSLTNVAIIGANGFIGKHLTTTIIQKPHLKLSLFGRNDSNDFSDKVPYHKLDLNNTEEINRHFKNIDLVYYLASDTIPSSSWEDPQFEIEKNLIPFINFLKCISKLRVKKIVFVSSAGTIYGPSNQKLTESSDKKPFSPYGINKLAMENYLNYFEAKYNLHHDIFRVSNVYGYGQDTSRGLGVINTFLEKIISDKNILIYGNGEIIRNYIYVNDVAELLSLSITANPNVSNIFNLASNDNLSINEIVGFIKQIINEDFKIVYKETRQSDNPAIYLDNTKIRMTFPNFKFSSIKDGIAKTYAFLKEKNGVKNN